MSNSAEASGSLGKAYWGAILSSVFGLALALLCLRQWGSPQPWLRLDRYSGGFLAVGVLLIATQALSFHRAAFRSREAAGEALGLSYDPGLLRWGTPLSLAGLTVFLDYAHWHLVPALEKPFLQSLGLALLVLAAAWLTWTDTWLTRHFLRQTGPRRVMTGGPFRFVRHPRYAAFLVGELAKALTLTSILGWILLVIWTLLIRKRILREEAHMRELFGSEYDDYSRQTSRLLPGLY